MKNPLLIQPRAIGFARISHLVMLAFALIASFVIYDSLKPKDSNNFQNSPMPVGGSGGDQITASPVPYDIVFVSRKIVKHGANSLDSLTDMPGVGPHSRFRDCAPGKLQIFKTNGTLVTLIDGNNPTAASLNLIDVNAPDVSYDGTQIVFAGLPAPTAGTQYDTLPKKILGAWRIYKINVNGTGLTQITNSSLVINTAQFISGSNGNATFAKYDDTDPIWMPDGRICFSSSRAPSTAEYGGARTTNLWVMNNNGTSQHRITSERNGAERPMIDPLTGKIIFSRWWRNGRFPIDDMTTQANSTATGYLRKDGLSSDGSLQSVAPNFIHFNGWVETEINPDGTDLGLFAGGRGDAPEFEMYGGSFTSTNNLVGNYFPDNKLTAEGGFGGITTHVRGVGNYIHLLGITGDTSPVNAPAGTPDSLKRYFPTEGFATDAHVLPNDKIVFSWAANYNQDYGLYVMDANGTNKTLIYNATGTTELRPKAIRARTLAPVITDVITQVASLYPPLATPPYNTEGTFNFNCLNVFGNGPVDMDITSAPGIGKASSIRFFVNHQRTRVGSDSEKDWPILLKEMAIPPSGAVLNTEAPANLPLFEQLRSSVAKGYVVPTTGTPFPNSTAHVAGMNYGRPGSTNTCIGCHRGHTLIPIPTNQADAKFTNLAPGATVQVSSTKDSLTYFSLNDRGVQLDLPKEFYWTTFPNVYQNQWARLKFDVPIKIKTVRLYNIPQGGTKASTLQVTQAQVNIYSDVNATQLVSTQTITQNISVAGTDVTFANVVGQCVEVKILNVTGTFNAKRVAGLAEVEVIASGNTTGPRLAEDVVSDNNNLVFDANVFPNPVTDRAHLILKADNNGNVDYTVLTLNGEVVISKTISVSKDETTDNEIDLTTQPQGIYLVKVKSSNSEKVFRIVKM